MDKQNEIEKTKVVVERFLKEDVKCRNNDNRLFCKVAAHFNPEVKKSYFDEVFNDFDDFGIPGFETVRRTRQKLQAEHEEYRAATIVQEYRKENEEIFREEFK